LTEAGFAVKFGKKMLLVVD